MKILIDIGHPGHIHLLKNLYFQLVENGHRVYVTVKNIKIQKDLLEKYNIEYIEIGDKKDSLVKKALFQIIYNLKILKLVIQNDIELGIGTSMTLAHVSKLSKMKSILLDDDDDKVQELFVKYAHPFCDYLLTPSALKGNRASSKSIFYDGYHELAYLHPKYFSPDINVLNELNVKKEDIFFIMRFNVFKAYHDVGVNGLSLDQKLKLVDSLKGYGKVFITTERDIEPELKEYQLSISPEKMHSLMYYSTMFLGDSQTMTSEAAVLGVPALKLNSFAGKLSIPNELEDRYELCYSYGIENFEAYHSKVITLLEEPNLKKIWKKKREKLLNEKIDVTAFFSWLIEKYPKNIEILKQDPSYQIRFK